MNRVRLVVADTSPINYLIRIGQIGLLPQLYGEIFIPLEVRLELERAQVVPEVRAWAGSPPEWLRIESPRASSARLRLGHLDPGEREAITLAIDLRADVILIDDASGRAAAKSEGLEPTGTLGILAIAAQLGLVDFEEMLASLLATNFRCSATVIATARKQAAQGQRF